MPTGIYERKIRKTLEEQFWSKVDRRSDDECWNWTGAKLRDGYGSIRKYHKLFQAHRLSYIIHYGDVIANLCVLHKCDNPSCVNPKHLFLGDHLINARDKVSKNRQAKGEAHPKSKLTGVEIQKIRELYENGSISMRKIAKQFGMCYSEINAIINKRTWRFV